LLICLEIIVYHTNRIFQVAPDPDPPEEAPGEVVLEGEEVEGGGGGGGEAELEETSGCC
jgi:hypothetical protein